MEKPSIAGEEKKLIEEAVQELIEKMGISCEVEVREIIREDQTNLICDIKTEDSNYLIGQYGVNLQALQHISRIIVRKKKQDKINFILDVNSYRQEKNDSVLAMAKSMTEKALLEKRAVVLRPMSAYERRLVHMELAKNDEIKTESVGEGEDRRVVIKPVGLE